MELLYISVIGLVSLAAFGVWIWTLLDCVRMEPRDSSERWIWILIIFLASGLGAVVYLLYRRPQRIRLFGR